MAIYITHFLTESLPEKGYRQLSFLTSNSEDLKKSIFYYGYDGSVPLTENSLSLEIKEGKIFKLDTPIDADGVEKYLWLDANGNIWTSDDILLSENKKLIGPSDLKPLATAYISNVYNVEIKPVIGSLIWKWINLRSEDLFGSKLTPNKRGNKRA